MMVKSGLEQVCLKFLHVLTMSFLLCTEFKFTETFTDVQVKAMLQMISNLHLAV